MIVKLNGGVTAVNTWGPAGLLARQSGGVNTYYAWDALGNVAQTLSSGGSVTNTFSWDAYGKGVSTFGSSDPYAGFGGQWGYYTDHETGLTLCGARFYDSNAGRWVTRDPAGYGGGINLYAYCGNNPLSSIDPSGLLPVDPFDDSPDRDQDYTSDLNAGPHPGLSGGIAMTNHLLHLIPGYGLLPGLTGQDLMGCPITPWQQLGEAASGALSAAGALSSLGDMAGEAVNVGGSAAGEASGANKILVLGRNMGSSAQSDMVQQLVKPRGPYMPSDLQFISNPATEMQPFMDSAGEIHFNMADTSPSFLADLKRYTSQEWNYLVNNPALHPKSTLYNVPTGVTIPSTLRIGTGF